MYDLTANEARKLKKILKEEFPWLDTEQEVNGGDLVDQFSGFYKEVKRLSQRDPQQLSPEEAKEIVTQIFKFFYEDVDDKTDEVIYTKDAIPNNDLVHEVWDYVCDIFRQHNLEPAD